MKKILMLLVLLLAFSLTGCSGEDEGAGGEAAVGETGVESELVLGKNAFGASFTVKKVSDEPVTFYVEPFADKFERGSNVFEMGEGTGIWGGDALIPGTKKGNKAELDGSFTIYANDKNGPSVTIDVNGTYEIDEEGYCETEDYLFFYLYEGGQFIESDRETVIAP